jgi:GxxExxY protein
MNVFEFRERGTSGVDPAVEDLAQMVIGAAIEVHKHMGPGLPETSYRNALSHELTLRGVEHACEVSVPILYKGVLVGEGKVDMLIGNLLVVELKVVEALNDVHRAQVIAYLQALKLQLGLLINFNVVRLSDGIKRVIRSNT